MTGYCGKLLRVELSSGKISEEKLDEEIARKFLGGRGLGAKILFDEMPPGADPLGPENKLIFATGPMAGTYLPGCGRFAVVSKSPATGGFGESYSGGFFAHELKYAGYDAVIVDGKSPSNAYIDIHNGKVEIRDASYLTGKDTADANKLIKKELRDREYKVLSIGLAGENLVRFACIMNDGDRTAGRTGLGAVMGSKNLKAIAVRGTGGVRLAYPERFRKHALSNLEKLMKNPWHSGAAAELGTSGCVEPYSAMGILPTRYWEKGTFEGSEKISGLAMKNTILLGNRSCQACPVACGRIVEVKTGPFGGVRPEYGGPEYETIAALGSLCENDNLESIAMANQLCNAYGMDTISTGSVIAFTMECYDKGLITERDIGFALEWGDAEAIVKLVGLIARREGFGNILADGVGEAASNIGEEAIRLAVEVRGLEAAMHEPRGKKGLGLSYATAPRGAVHTEGFHDTHFVNENSLPQLGIVKAMDPFQMEGKAPYVRIVENYKSFVNTLIICSFMAYTFAQVVDVDDVTEMLAAATGWEGLSLEEEMAIGERAFNLARVITIREKGGIVEDRLPLKYTRPLQDGACENNTISEEELTKGLSEYYQARGWTPEGIPSKEKLAELGLEEATMILEKMGAYNGKNSIHSPRTVH